MAYVLRKWASRLQIHREKTSPRRRGIRPLQERGRNGSENVPHLRTRLHVSRWRSCTRLECGVKRTNLREEPEDAFFSVDRDDGV